jgi:hypothetical protein
MNWKVFENGTWTQLDTQVQATLDNFLLLQLNAFNEEEKKKLFFFSESHVMQRYDRQNKRKYAIFRLEKIKCLSETIYLPCYVEYCTETKQVSSLWKTQ